jgi:hypothetical protein
MPTPYSFNFPLDNQNGMHQNYPDPDPIDGQGPNGPHEFGPGIPEPSAGGGPGGFNIADLFKPGGLDGILSGAMNMAPGVGSGNIPLALLIPSLTAAMNQWKDSDRYMDYGREAAGMASPVSNEERQRSLARYRSIENDPNGYLNNSPLYQAALRQGLNATERSQAAQGNMGSGEMMMALNKVGQDTATQFVDRDLQRIRQDAGFQFDPANAARFFMQGVQGSIDSRNSALGSLMFPFMAMAQQNANGGPGGGPGGGRNPNGGGGPGQPGNGVNVPQGVAQAIFQGGQAGINAASQLLQQGIRFINNPDGSTTDLHGYLRSGAPGNGGEDYPRYPTGYPGTTTPPITDGNGNPLYDDEGNLMPPIDDGGMGPPGSPYPLFDDEGNLMPNVDPGMIEEYIGNLDDYFSGLFEDMWNIDGGV